MQINPPRYFNLAKLSSTLGIALGGQYDPTSVPPTLMFTELHTYDVDGLPLELTPAQQTVISGTNDAPPVLTPPPDIKGLITALASSPSIDQPTKDALTKALEGS